MAMPQRDNWIDQILRIEGLIAYAEQHGEKEELERLKAMLLRLLEKMT